MSKEGGSNIQILSFNGDKAIICISSNNANARQCASTENIYGKVYGRVIDFQFQEDGWGGSGHGTIWLGENEIYLSLGYDYVDSYARWQLEESGTFHKITS